MRGHIRKQGKNSWQITVDLGNGQDGKRRRYFETVKGAKKDAQRKLAQLLVNAEKGIVTTTGSSAVAAFLQEWLDGPVKSRCSARTLEVYRTIAKNHIIPSLGAVKLRNLEHAAIQRFYDGDAMQGLSPRSVRHIHGVLKAALKYGVKQGYLGRNPCDLVDTPAAPKKLMRTLTPEELDTLLKAAEGNPYYPLIYTAVSSGLRQGELLALRWRDMNLDLASMSVSRSLSKRHRVCTFKEPKTKKSRRKVDMTPKLALFLKGYRKQQEIVYLELGKVCGLDELVFLNLPSGKPLDPYVVSHVFKKIARRAGFEDVRFHDLRHTFASLMLLRGASPKVISEALGHASVAFTMDTYSHIIDGMQQDAMNLLNGVLPDGCLKNSVADSSRNLAI